MILIRSGVPVACKFEIDIYQEHEQLVQPQSPAMFKGIQTHCTPMHNNAMLGFFPTLLSSEKDIAVVSISNLKGIRWLPRACVQQSSPANRYLLMTFPQRPPFRAISRGW